MTNNSPVSANWWIYFCYIFKLFEFSRTNYLCTLVISEHLNNSNNDVWWLNRIIRMSRLSAELKKKGLLFSFFFLSPWVHLNTCHKNGTQRSFFHPCCHLAWKTVVSAVYRNTTHYKGLLQRTGPHSTCCDTDSCLISRFFLDFKGTSMMSWYWYQGTWWFYFPHAVVFSPQHWSRVQV